MTDKKMKGKKTAIENSIAKVEKNIKSKKRISGDRKDKLSDNLDDISTKVDKLKKNEKLSDSKATSLKNKVGRVKNLLDTDIDVSNEEKSNKKGSKKENEKKPVTKIIMNSMGMTQKEALEKANRELGKIFDKTKNKIEDIETKKIEDLEEDIIIKELEKQEIRTIFPNLKYNQPKYSNVSELIKYVESDKPQEGGVKIIIMNFND